MTGLTLDVARTPLGPEWAGLTFPAYGHLLGLLGLDRADAEGCRPIACTARLDDRPAGLVLAGLPTAARPAAELLSIYVAQDLRDRGLGTTMVAALEEELASRGAPAIEAVYMSGKAGVEALERVFEKRGFGAPQLRKIVVQCTPEEVSRADWYRAARLPASCTIFPWAELSREEYDALQRSQAASPWIPQILEPWSCGQHVDAVSSVGLRAGGQVAGWVLTHRVPPNLIRYTSCFVRADLQRWGLMLPLIVASADRLMGTGVRCTFVTSSQFPEMVAFAHRRLAPLVSYCGASMGVTKTLAG